MCLSVDLQVTETNIAELFKTMLKRQMKAREVLDSKTTTVEEKLTAAKFEVEFFQMAQNNDKFGVRYLNHLGVSPLDLKKNGFISLHGEFAPCKAKLIISAKLKEALALHAGYTEWV